MGFRSVKSRKAVIAAISECQRMGREAFRKHYKFDQSDSYFLRYQGLEYDSKPIIAVAHKYQFPDLGPLPNDFSGGKGNAGGHLARLGFSIDGVNLNPADWSLTEVELIVKDYFEMLQLSQAGKPFNKSERRRELQKHLPKRNVAAISQKQSNISAILDRMQLPRLPGMKPRPNSQTLLEAVVHDWISDNAEFFEQTPDKIPETSRQSQVEVKPPSFAQLNDATTSRRAVRINFAERDHANRKLGKAGERWALSYLKRSLAEDGRPDLAEKVDWVSDTKGDGLGYDILSFSVQGEPLFIEVKTTNGGLAAPFLLTANELGMSKTEKGYVLMRIFDFRAGPRFYSIKGSLEAECQLVPHVYRALPAKK